MTLKVEMGIFSCSMGAIAFIETDPTVHLGRNAIKGLKDHKALGDQSAHNRRVWRIKTILIALVMGCALPRRNFFTSRASIRMKPKRRARRDT